MVITKCCKRKVKRLGVEVKKSNKTPLYLQLAETLIKKIENKEFQVYEKLPPERKLCDFYNVSRITVRQSLQELERDGYIYRSHGSGTFVAPKSYSQNLIHLYSFTDEMKALGKNPDTKVLSFKEMDAEERLADKMKLDSLESVFQVVRLRSADNYPLMYETTYVPKRMFPGLTEQFLKTKPMYEVFNEDYQVIITKASESFSVTTVRKEEAKYLQMQENEPAMLINRYAYHNQKLIAYSVSIARGDKFHYNVELD